MTDLAEQVAAIRHEQAYFLGYLADVRGLVEQLVARRAKVKGKAPRRPRNPTRRQLEVVERFNACNGDIGAVAKALGISRQAVVKTYTTAVANLAAISMEDVARFGKRPTCRPSKTRTL